MVASHVIKNAIYIYLNVVLLSRMNKCLLSLTGSTIFIHARPSPQTIAWHALLCTCPVTSLPRAWRIVEVTQIFKTKKSYDILVSLLLGTSLSIEKKKWINART